MLTRQQKQNLRRCIMSVIGVIRVKSFMGFSLGVCRRRQAVRSISAAAAAQCRRIVVSCRCVWISERISVDVRGHLTNCSLFVCVGRRCHHRLGESFVVVVVVARKTHITLTATISIKYYDANLTKRFGNLLMSRMYINLTHSVHFQSTKNEPRFENWRFK